MRKALIIVVLAGVAPAWAVPVGDPVPDPEAGRLRLDARLGNRRVPETDTRCSGSTGCRADWSQTEAVGGAHLAVIRGLGLYGELGRAQDQIQAADYKGRSRVWAAGLRAAVPLGRDLWLASNGRVDGGEGESIHADEEPDPERADYRLMSGTILVAWGSSGAGASAWAGAQSSWHWDHHVWPLGSKATEVRLDVPLAPTQQLSGVVGCGMTSEPVGLPWRTSPRLTVALEARAGQEWGVSGWVGVAL